MSFKLRFPWNLAEGVAREAPDAPRPQLATPHHVSKDLMDLMDLRPELAQALRPQDRPQHPALRGAGQRLEPPTGPVGLRVVLVFALRF